MTDEIDRIRARYENQPTEALLAMLLSDEESFTEVGRRALEAELEARGLSVEQALRRHAEAVAGAAQHRARLADRLAERIERIDAAGREPGVCLACRREPPTIDRHLERAHPLEETVPVRVPLCAGCAPRWRAQRIPGLLTALLFIAGLALGVAGILVAIRFGLSPENEWLRIPLFGAYICLVLAPGVLAHRWAEWRSRRVARLHPAFHSLQGSDATWSPGKPAT